MFLHASLILFQKKLLMNINRKVLRQVYVAGTIRICMKEVNVLGRSFKSIEKYFASYYGPYLPVEPHT